MCVCMYSFSQGITLLFLIAASSRCLPYLVASLLLAHGGSHLTHGPPSGATLSVTHEPQQHKKSYPAYLPPPEGRLTKKCSILFLSSLVAFRVDCLGFPPSQLVSQRSLPFVTIDW